MSEGRVEGCVFIFCENSKITTQCWTTIYRRMLDPTKKDTPCPRAKEKTQKDSCCRLVAKLRVRLFWPHGLWPARFLCPWDSPGKNTGMGCHFLLQGIFPTQESSPGLLHCRQILYQLSYEGSMKTVGGVKSHLESAPIPAREAWRAQTKPCAHQETPQRLSQACPWVFECLLWRYKSAVAWCRGGGSGCGRPGCGISSFGGGHH